MLEEFCIDYLYKFAFHQLSVGWYETVFVTSPLLAGRENGGA